VALKASRTSQGVPLLQDIPGLGLAFRPLPSDESSIQQNIILAHSIVYPTLFDLMGLRWAPSVVDLDHISVRDSGHVVRGRYQTLTDSIFDATSERVDEMLDIKQRTPEHFRPDLYHRHTRPSPYHPGGYVMPDADELEDPTGRGFQVPDPRPSDFQQEPPFDPRRRTPIRYDTTVYPDQAARPNTRSEMRMGITPQLASPQPGGEFESSGSGEPDLLPLPELGPPNEASGGVQRTTFRGPNDRREEVERRNVLRTANAGGSRG
jgi:hypothetical protein